LDQKEFEGSDFFIFTQPEGFSRDMGKRVRKACASFGGTIGRRPLHLVQSSSRTRPPGALLPLLLLLRAQGLPWEARVLLHLRRIYRLLLVNRRTK
jgi:hypothetical protein